MRVLLTRPIPADLRDRLAAVSDLTEREAPGPPSEAELLRLLPGHDAVVCQLTEPMTGAVLEAGVAGSPPLRLVAQVAVGLDNVDLAAARRLGVTVCHTPGVLTDATADLTLALLLAACRRVVEADRFVREGRWDRWSLDLLTGVELPGAQLGIVGLGRIGRAVARRARAFGMRVAYCGRAAAPAAVERELEAVRLPLPELLATSDVVTLHAPLTAQTRGMIDRAALWSMKPGAVLVNTARGGLLEEAAIAEALERGPLRAVGLDVFEDEPRVHPSLLDRTDVVLLPHLGSATDRTRHRMAELAVEAVEAFAGGGPVPHVAPVP